jgi:hypothetical protein
MIKKHLIVTLYDSRDLEAGIYSEGAYIRTTTDGVMFESTAPKMPISLDHLEEAIKAIRDFQKENTTTEEVKTPEHELIEVSHSREDWN